MFKKVCALFLVLIFFVTNNPVLIKAENENTDTAKGTDNSKDMDFKVDCEGAVLMEGSTGKIIYSSNATKRVPPASITKIMTMLLIFEAIDRGDISLEDNVSVSEHAAGMGGSQVFLEPNETQTVDTMIKCISIASANDACVAMAEYIAGTEEGFVKKMNERAAELGMKDTHFVNCCGLDTDNHYSSALDVAIMSRELVVKHPQISNYSTVWMDTIIHVTRRGSSEFGLTNTNKLVRYYDGITGLKTGSTGLAKYCLSATAKRNGMDLIAVIMGAPDTKSRFSQAKKLLDYGFAEIKLYKHTYVPEKPITIKVKGGVEDTIELEVRDEFSYILDKNKSEKNITFNVNVKKELTAPVNKDTAAGTIEYFLDGESIGNIGLYPKEEIGKAEFSDYYMHILKEYLK